MSRRLINLNQDLKRLQDEGYDIIECEGYLIMRNVPYLNNRCEVLRAALVSKLELAGDLTVKPNDHVIMFTGDHPCNLDGSEIEAIRHSVSVQRINDESTVQRSFSNKPIPDGYLDYHHKMTRY